MQAIIFNLPALHVLIPLFIAPIIVLFKGRLWPFLLCLQAVFLSLVVIIYNIINIQKTGPLEYYFSGWLAPYGITYKIDALAGVFLLLVATVTLLLLIFGYHINNKDLSTKPEKTEKLPLFYSMFLLCFAGFLGIISSNDIFNIYVFIEITALTTTCLIALGKDRLSLNAAFEYLILSTIGASFILISIGILYANIGSLSIDDILLNLGNKDQTKEFTKTTKLAFIFFILGVFIKLAVFPLHSWLLKTYEHAPGFFVSFLSAVSAKTIIYLLIRSSYFMFGAYFTFITMHLREILLVFGSVMTIFMSYLAIIETHNRRILALSSLAQIGLILIAVGLAIKTAILAAILAALAHATAKSAMFMTLTYASFLQKKKQNNELLGLIKTAPFTSILFIICCLSIIGIPGTAGFTAKWYLLTAILNVDLNNNVKYIVFAVVIISSILSLIYLLKFVEILIGNKNNENNDKTDADNANQPTANKTLNSRIKFLKKLLFSNSKKAKNYRIKQYQMLITTLPIVMPIAILVIINVFVGLVPGFFSEFINVLIQDF